ncbi:MAG: hypothetical protein HND58_06605 [Planctomycetota bacterium]|nr:MAG: hypothetical protein HND58_06605 [Planctomycetota bacterium]
MTDQPSQPVPPEAAALSRIVIATGNPHKVAELSRLLALPGVEFVGLKDLPGHESFTEPEEVGDTFEANATIKARSYAAQTGLPCLADDSGLEVVALGGAPGVISSHYCTDGREVGMSRAERDAANNAKLLRELEGVPAEERSARFVCVMVLAGSPSEVSHTPGGRAFQPASGTFSGAVQKSHAGNLPHWQVGGATYFVTFRLKSGGLSDSERQLVCDACTHWHGERILLHLATVMPNHVHMIFRPLSLADGSWPTLPSIMQSIKGYTSRAINSGRQTSGALWQSEYHDRVLRTPAEIEQKMEYVALNPVRAGLVQKPGEYPFSVRGDWERTAAGWKARPPVDPQAVDARGRPLMVGGLSPGILSTSRGTFEGRIGLPGPPPSGVPRGTNGFGYDPLFLVGPECRQTGAELSTQEKNRQSHRAVAAGDMLQQLRAHLRHA